MALGGVNLDYDFEKKNSEKVSRFYFITEEKSNSKDVQLLFRVITMNSIVKRKLRTVVSS